MAAIDESSSIDVVYYKDGEWVDERLSFPTAMTDKQLRDYLGYGNADHHYPSKEEPVITIYVKQREMGGLDYFIELSIFEIYVADIICEGTKNFIRCLSELKAFLDVSITDEFERFRNSPTYISAD